MTKGLYRWLKAGLSFTLGLALCGLLHGRMAVAQLPSEPLSTAAVAQQGLEAYQSGNFDRAIAVWQQLLPETSETSDRALLYSNLALAYRQTGKLSEAIAAWENAIALYRPLNKSEEIAQLLIEQAQTYNDLGQSERALSLLELPEIKNAQLTPHVRAALQGISGNAYSAMGKYDNAIAAYQSSLELARQLNDPRSIATTLSDLANVYRQQAERLHYQVQLAQEEGDRQAEELERSTKESWERSQQLFEESTSAAKQNAPVEEVRALLNYNRLLDSGIYPLAPEKFRSLTLAHWQRARELLPQISDSREKAYLLINLGNSFLRHPDFAKANDTLEVLENAAGVARKIGDRKAESFASGSLGELYETQLKDLSRAMDYTRQAQAFAQEVNAPDSLYRWQWQAGRILNALGQKQAAIAAYKGAIVSLQSIRSDLIRVNKDIQFDFRDRVEPVYRQLLALLLDSQPAAIATRNKQLPKDAKASATTLSEIINILENLKLAEIQNFFGDDCVELALNNARENRSLSETNTAAIYTIILDDRLYTILQRPDNTTQYYAANLSSSEIDEEITQFRYFLEDRTSGRYLPLAQKLYDLLLRPLETDLAAAKPETLLFINDGVLRKIPMAALHDGKVFLIQKYPLVVAPSVSLTVSKPLARDRLKALSVGLTEGKILPKTPSTLQLSFAPLKNVRAEMEAVQQIFGGVTLLDRDFNRNNFATQIQHQEFAIVHMSTHGRFGVNAESTFVLADDGPLAIDELDNILRSRERPVALLALSACQTAVGDNRSTLGIAGVAVRAGVESALATLWFINDEATVPLIQTFYQQLLDPSVTKAEALRRAQLKMLENHNYSHPALWSPFILIGNWL
ncbi:CHAT domain-containing protein [Oscillatoria sp. FACHB-1406]|uniref:CHAT domain-containing protein n=1 Tax=Oscillatoria sp. FACHB-1406 TaxID=2692846 RepID=UPI001688201E|nr:CHAT domain-containing protein [Oscillatoria sp. FACHB-1406]MBD2576258.1 CHAT domain-containing protein [Oscillatoria sp. FACHB-1406]